MAVAPSYQFTSQDEIERLFSQMAIKLRTDDLAGVDIASWWEEHISDATLRVWTYLHLLYGDTTGTPTSDLVNSYWIRRRATWIACYYISQRRGNPAQFSERYAEIIDELEQVHLGFLQVPELPTSAKLTPAMDNVIVDMRYPLSKLRVQVPLSTDTPAATMLPAYLIPFEWA
jgi:hypothetical protein